MSKSAEQLSESALCTYDTAASEAALSEATSIRKNSGDNVWPRMLAEEHKLKKAGTSSFCKGVARFLRPGPGLSARGKIWSEACIGTCTRIFAHRARAALRHARMGGGIDDLSKRAYGLTHAPPWASPGFLRKQWCNQLPSGLVPRRLGNCSVDPMAFLERK